MSAGVAMFLFSLSMSISPGPINMMSLSSGINYGFKKTFPFVSGASVGFTILLIMAGVGLTNTLSRINGFYQVLEYIGIVYIGFMGYKIICSNEDIQWEKKHLPKFYQGFLMQWLNPKAWIACLSGIVAFNIKNPNMMLLVFVIIYFPTCYLSLAAWAFLGSKMQFLNRVRNGIKIFNALTGGALIVVAMYLLYKAY